MIFPNISWQRVAEVGVIWQKRQTDRMALSCPSSLPTIQDVTMKCVGSLMSPKTKGSVIPQAEWSRSEDLANVSQGRTNVNIEERGGGPHLPCKA